MCNFKKLIVFMLVCILFSLISLNVFATSGIDNDGVFQSDFSSDSDKNGWKFERDDGTGKPWDEDGFKISDGAITPERQGLILGMAYNNKKYTNVLIETTINKDTRIEFRCNSASAWASKRYYVEIQFAGSVVLRNEKDEEVASALIYDMVSRESTDVKIKVYGKTVEVYVKGSQTANLVYSDLKVSEGYCGIMLIRQDTSIQGIKYTPLDDQGLFKGKNLVGSGTTTTTQSDNNFSYESSKDQITSKNEDTDSNKITTPSSEQSSQITQSNISEDQNSQITNINDNNQDSKKSVDKTLIIVAIICFVIIAGTALAVILIMKRGKTSNNEKSEGKQE